MELGLGNIDWWGHLGGFGSTRDVGPGKERLQLVFCCTARDETRGKSTREP